VSSRSPANHRWLVTSHVVPCAMHVLHVPVRNRALGVHRGHTSWAGSAALGRGLGQATLALCSRVPVPVGRANRPVSPMWAGPLRLVLAHGIGGKFNSFFIFRNDLNLFQLQKFISNSFLVKNYETSSIILLNSRSIQGKYKTNQ
jgi:hypothetical protein